MFVKFKEITGADIYITSYFRVGRESNTTYPADVVRTLPSADAAEKIDPRITFEMYNTTFIYMVPKENTQEP